MIKDTVKKLQKLDVFADGFGLKEKSILDVLC